MKNLGHVPKIILLLILVIILSFSLILSLNPLRHSKALIRLWILREIPMGTNMRDAIFIIKTETKWEIKTISKDHGYWLDNDGDPKDVSDEDLAKNRNLVGDKYIKIYLGSYRVVFWCAVEAFLGFDAEGNLISVSVRKDYDSL